MQHSLAVIDDLFAAIRKSVPGGEWSVGVSLARDGAVVGETVEPDEITLRVIVGSRRRSFEVTLWPEDEEWQCDCPDGNDRCGHLAAAVIALRKAMSEGKELPEGSIATARLGYRLTTSKDALAITRVEVLEGAERPFLGSLTTDGSSGGAAIVTGQTDLMIERTLSQWRRGPIPKQTVQTLLGLLAKVDDVKLNGEVVKTSDSPVTPRAELTDSLTGQGHGFVLTLVPAVGITSMFTNRAVVCEGVVRPVGDGGLTEREFNELPSGRYYGPADAGELVSEVLPRLKRRIPVDIKTKRLPEVGGDPPRLILEVSDIDEQLTVLPILVYGDPPIARVDQGHLVLLSKEAIPLRDVTEERRLIKRLQGRMGMSPGRRVQMSGEDAVALAGKLARLEESVDLEVMGDAHQDYYLAPMLEADFTLGDDGSFEVGFGADGKMASPARVMRAWSKGLSLAPLEGGGWSPLPVDWLARFGPAVANLLAAKEAAAEDDGTLPMAAFADVVALCDAMDRPIPDRFAGLRALLDDGAELKPHPLPEDLTATLRDYQRDGVDWLTLLRDAGLGAMLADDMGLGKTLQTLCAVQGRTLVVAPTSVLHNWAAEAKKFRPSLTTHIYHGPKRALDPKADMTLTTYGTMRVDIDALSAEAWDSVVLDESQTIKNPNSQVARASRRLPGAFRVALTGTPVENRLDDLWSQFQFINPHYLGSQKTFKERYVDPIMGGEAGAAAQLRERVRPFILRRLKRDVAKELPPRTDIVLRCELQPEERDVYDAIRAATQREVVERLSSGGNVLAALEALLRLRQAACHRGLIPGQQASGSSKVDLLVSRLEELVSEGHKALVFSQWTSMLDRIEPHLKQSDIDFNRLDGSTKDRQGVVNAFQDPDGPPVMLLSLKAGGTGLNLTAADHVFLVDPWWNPAVEDQAADRAHRIGQERPVLVHRLVAADTVEERILALQSRKRQLAESAVGTAGGAGQSSKFGRDELLALLA